MSWDWLTANFSTHLADLGIIVGLFFTGYGFWRDARIRRAQTLLDITTQHRELWTAFDERPELAGLFDKARDLAARPLTSEEVRFANFLFLHIRASRHAEKARMYPRPDRLREDLQEIFSHPAIGAAWEKMKRLHDREFVAYVEGILN